MYVYACVWMCVCVCVCVCVCACVCGERRLIGVERSGDEKRAVGKTRSC